MPTANIFTTTQFSIKPGASVGPQTLSGDWFILLASSGPNVTVKFDNEGALDFVEGMCRNEPFKSVMISNATGAMSACGQFLSGFGQRMPVFPSIRDWQAALLTSPILTVPSTAPTLLIPVLTDPILGAAGTCLDPFIREAFISVPQGEANALSINSDGTGQGCEVAPGDKIKVPAKYPLYAYNAGAVNVAVNVSYT